MNEIDASVAIEEVIQTYFDGMYESSKSKVEEAFHPNAMIVGHTPNNDLFESTRDSFGDFVESQKPSAKEKGEPAYLEVLSIDVAGRTAVARVKDIYMGQTFIDSLSLVRDGASWKIYNKLYHMQ